MPRGEGKDLIEIMAGIFYSVFNEIMPLKEKEISDDYSIAGMLYEGLFNLSALPSWHEIMNQVRRAIGPSNKIKITHYEQSESKKGVYISLVKDGKPRVVYVSLTKTMLLMDCRRV